MLGKQLKIQLDEIENAKQKETNFNDWYIERSISLSCQHLRRLFGDYLDDIRDYTEMGYGGKISPIRDSSGKFSNVYERISKPEKYFSPAKDKLTNELFSVMLEIIDEYRDNGLKLLIERSYESFIIRVVTDDDRLDK